MALNPVAEQVADLPRMGQRKLCAKAVSVGPSSPRRPVALVQRALLGLQENAVGALPEGLLLLLVLWLHCCYRFPIFKLLSYRVRSLAILLE